MASQGLPSGWPCARDRFCGPPKAIPNRTSRAGWGISGSTVGKWRGEIRFRKGGGVGVIPMSLGPVAPRKITDVRWRESGTRTLESLPEAAEPFVVSTIGGPRGRCAGARYCAHLDSFGLQTHRSEKFKCPPIL